MKERKKWPQNYEIKVFERRVFFLREKNQLSAYSIRKLNLKKAIERKKRQKNALMVLCRLEIKTHSWINRYY